MSTGQQRPRLRFGLAGLVTTAAIAVAVILVVNRGAGQPGQLTSPQPSSESTPEATAQPTAAEASPTGTSAAVVTTGIWYSQITYQKYLVGKVGRPGVVSLKPGEIPIGGAADIVVSVQRTASETALTITDLSTRRPLLQTTVPFNVGTAAVTADGRRVFITGADWDGSVVTDAGVVEVDLGTGALTQLVEPLDLLPEWKGEGQTAGRGLLVLSPTGATLATTLCGGPPNAEGTCLVQVVDLASGEVRGSFGPITSYLAATTDTTVITRTQLAVFAFTPDGQERWTFEAQEIRGPVVAGEDNVYFTYASLGTVVPTRLVSVSVETGQAVDLLVAEVDRPLELWPSASDRQTVIFAEEPMEIALARGRPVSLRAIDIATGQIKPAGSVSPEG